MSNVIGSKMGTRLRWRQPQTKGALVPSDMTITHVNQTAELLLTEANEVAASQHQKSCDWLKTHSIEFLNLTLKDLVSKGIVLRPEMDRDAGKIKQRMEFDIKDLNEFEYKVNGVIGVCTSRIKYCMQGSKKTFGLVNGENVGILVDVSEANFGFGRRLALQNALMHLIDEQLATKTGLYFASFGSDVQSLWPELRLVNKSLLEEAKNWVMNLTSQGGSNLLSALKHIYQCKGVQTVIVILGSLPDQNLKFIDEYLEQLCIGREIQIHSVSYDCSDHQTNVLLMKMSSVSNGNYHCSNSTVEEAIYASFDVRKLLEEIKRCQDVLNRITEIKQGKFGSALVTVIDQLSNKIISAPDNYLFKNPPGHDLPLRIETSSCESSSSACWISKNGLKARGLDLYQVLAPNAFSFREEFIPIIRKTVQSQVHSKAMTQFQWHDGTLKNVHVDMTTLFEYQKQLGAMVKLFENRIEWLSASSRSIFGTIIEKKIVLLLDLSLQNTKYLVAIQNSLRLLFEQQLLNTEYFNVIGCGSEVKMWMPTLVRSTGDRLQQAWRWVLNFGCGGSRNILEGLRRALENDDQIQHNIEVEGIYLFISGVPDQSPDLLYSYLEEIGAGRGLRLHVVLFNVDDYDANGAIPSKYANITKTAEILRNMAHCTGGRFQWLQETGIIESDDVSALSREIEKALNFSRKCAMLVDSVKKRQGLNENCKESDVLIETSTLSLPPGTTVRSLPPPKETVLSQARRALVSEKEKDNSIPKALAYDHGHTYQPPASSAKQNGGDRGKGSRQSSAKAKTQKARSRRRVDQAFFYTGNKNDIGSVFTKYPVAEQKFRPNKRLCSVLDKEEQMSTKDWMQMYSLSKLKLNLDKLAAGSECHHISHMTERVQILGGKTVDAKLCKIFPTINVSGSLRHLLLTATDLAEFEEQAESVLTRYLRRLQWLLSGSREIFGTIVDKKCIFLIDISGSMEDRMEDLRKKLILLIWEQLHKYKIRFNLIKFSKTCERWKPSIIEPSDENCQEAVHWVTQLQASGNTCTLEALQMAFQETDLDAIYLLTDGKPDSSFSLVLQELKSLNLESRVIINTISFNCADSTANEFLQTMAHENRGRYHSTVEKSFDVHLFAHQLIEGKFEDPQLPIMPEFGGDDLKRLAKEITKGRKYIAQSRTYRKMFEELKKVNEEVISSHDCMSSSDFKSTSANASKAKRPISAKP